MEAQTRTGEAVAEHPTVAPSWQPRSESWLRQAPSSYAGTANRPLFIGACPRTGTTLLRSLLNNHPEIAIPPETNFVLPVWRVRRRWGDLRLPENRRRLAEWIFDTPGRGGKRIRGEIERDAAVERVAAAPPTLGSVLAACFELFAERKGKTRWGDKRPRYANYVGMIFRLFPNAQFVHLVRDPRAAAASQAPLGWDEPEAALPSAICTWEFSLRRVDLYARRLRPDQLLDVRYEDLVRDPHSTLERICAFAGLAGGAAIEEMITRPRRGVFNEGWHDRLGEPIMTAPIDAWRERLEPHEVALVEHATRRHFERLGYRPDPDVDSSPTAADLAQLRKQRRRRRRKYRRYALSELKRRLVYRYPVAAVPRGGS